MNRKLHCVFWHGIGDNILALPLIAEMKKKLDVEEIHWGVIRRVEKTGLFDYCKSVDSVFVVTDPWHDGDKDYATAKEDLRAEQQKEAERLSRKLLFCDFYAGMDIHRWDAMANCLGAGGTPPPERFVALLSGVAGIFARAWWRVTIGSGFDNGRKVLALHRGAENAKKAWDYAEAMRFCEMVKERLPDWFIIAFDREDERNSGNILKGNNVFSLVETTLTIPASYELIKKCAMFVGSDSAPMWLANATDVPMVSLFTKTWPQRTAPFRGRLVLSARIGRETSAEYLEKEKGRIRVCEGDIKAEDVFEECRSVLGGG
jgi:ADP-heptose:LPS heptosyltransferase